LSTFEEYNIVDELKMGFNEPALRVRLLKSAFEDDVLVKEGLCEKPPLNLIKSNNKIIALKIFFISF